MFEIIIVLIMILYPLSSGVYSTLRDQEVIEVLYEAPDGGLSLSVGEWISGSFDAPAAKEGVSRMIAYNIDVLDWDGCPDPMWVQHGCRMMTLEEFLMMNDTSRWDEGFASGSIITRANPIERGYHGASSRSGSQVWAFRFVDSNWNITSGIIRIDVMVLLRESVLGT
ncbi:MAG: hypothetical protein RTU92_13075 [Candidatus Thorarchaeota archaeon]